MVCLLPSKIGDVDHLTADTRNYTDGPVMALNFGWYYLLQRYNESKIYTEQ